MSTLRLTRARKDVLSFLSILGGLRETRLTAVLGFLVSRFPKEFGPVLGFATAPGDEISVEESGDGDRYDVLIRASGEIHIVEGKIGPEQNEDQLLRYIKNCRKKPSLTVVDDGSKFRQFNQTEFQKVRRRVKSLKHVTWAEVADACLKITCSARSLKSDRLGTVIAEEFYTHLKENNMTNEPQPEIYLRDVSTIESVKLYFRHNIYKCQPSFYNSARSNRYFAPYFTKKMAAQISSDNLVPVGEGISFVSKVKGVQLVKRGDVVAFLKGLGHKNAAETADLIRKNHDLPEILIMRLDDPRLMFVSPVTKAKLGRAGLSFTQGAMGSRSCTFDNLLAASQI